jgi:hypothetical protein
VQNRSAIGKVGLLIFCWVLSFAAMSLSLTEPGSFSFWMRVFVPVMLIFGYLSLWKIPRVFCRWQLWAAAVFFAAVVTLGASFDAAGSAALIAAHKGKALFYFLGRVPAFYMGMALVWEAMKNGRLWNRRYPAWVFAALIFACWLPYLVTVWPGTVSNDSITQLTEIYGSKPLSNGNPLFQTGLIWLCGAIGQGVFRSANAAIALYALLQGLLMAWLLGYTVSRMAGGGAPMWLMLLALGFYAICPVFPLFAFCVGKDTNFAMAVLWLSLIVWRMVSAGSPTTRGTVFLCVCAVLCVLLRNAGAGLVVVTLTALLVWSLVRRNQIWRSALYALTCAALALFILYAALIPALSAEESPETEMLSVPLQQVARVVTNEELPDEYFSTVNAVLPVDELKAAYNGQLSDPVKDLWREDATKAEKRTFFKAWAKLSFTHPGTYLSALFHNSYGYVMPGFVSQIKPTFLLGAEGDTDELDGKFDFTVNPHAESMKTVLKRLLQYAPFRILAAPGLYGWAALFALAVVMKAKQWRMLLYMLPGLLTLAGCFVSPVNGYFRYAMPVYFAAPVLLCAATLAIRKPERSSNDEITDRAALL